MNGPRTSIDHGTGTLSSRNSFQSHGRSLSTAQATALVGHDLACSTPSDGNYLHLIAAQERRVLELKEELHRAEAELNRWKRDWARLEVTRKREAAGRITRLHSLASSSPAGAADDGNRGSNSNSNDHDGIGGDDDCSRVWLQHETERRKALLSAARTSGRTVFPGQRHTRTLSLLTPSTDQLDRGPALPPRPVPPPRKESLRNPLRQSEDGPRPKLSPVSAPVQRSSTASDPYPLSDPRAPTAEERSLDHDALLRAGKKVATDLKDGLWTFWEDLRQATVGEEAMANPHHHPTPPPPPASLPRHKASTQTLKGAAKRTSRTDLRDSSSSSASAALPDLANPSFWSEHGIAVNSATPKPATQKTPTSASKSSKRLSVVSSSSSSAAWDAWDEQSPKASRSSSSVASEPTTHPSTVSGSPTMKPLRSSPASSPVTTSSISAAAAAAAAAVPTKKDSLPWPALRRSSGLGSLRRTASHLLSEWERSFSPGPCDEFTAQHDYLGDWGASAEAAAYGAATAGTKRGKHD